MMARPAGHHSNPLLGTKPPYRSQKHVDAATRPASKSKPVRPEVIDACKKIQAELRKAPDKGSDTARRAASLARRVFDHAANLGIITDGRNPAATAKATLFPLEITHHAAVTDPVGVGKLLASIDEYSARSPVVEYALKIISYIFVRPYEQRHLRREWVNLKDSMLIVPNKCLKRVKGDDRSGHYVPLAPRVSKLFKELHDVTGDSPYVFPSMTSRNRAMSDNAITSAFRRMGYGGDVTTWHGFRTIRKHAPK